MYIYYCGNIFKSLNQLHILQSLLTVLSSQRKLSSSQLPFYFLQAIPKQLEYIFFFSCLERAGSKEREPYTNTGESILAKKCC